MRPFGGPQRSEGPPMAADTKPSLSETVSSRRFGRPALEGGAVRLARTELRQPMEPHHLLWCLELRDPPGGEPPPALLEVERGGRLDEGGDPFSHQRVWVAHRHCVADVGMSLQ